MATRAEFAAYMAEQDARTLEEAVRVIRRLKVKFPTASQAQVCNRLSEIAKQRRFDALGG